MWMSPYHQNLYGYRHRLFRTRLAPRANYSRPGSCSIFNGEGKKLWRSQANHKSQDARKVQGSGTFISGLLGYLLRHHWLLGVFLVIDTFPRARRSSGHRAYIAWWYPIKLISWICRNFDRQCEKQRLTLTAFGVWELAYQRSKKKLISFTPFSLLHK